MKFYLRDLEAALEKSFAVESCGNMNQIIQQVKFLHDAEVPAEENTLYIIRQSQIPLLHGESASAPVLCVGKSFWNLEHSRPQFPDILLVIASSEESVINELSEFLYLQGSRASTIPEITAEFLRCRKIEDIVQVGYRYLENPFCIYDSDGKSIASAGNAELKTSRGAIAPAQSVADAERLEESRKNQMPVRYYGSDKVERMCMALYSRGKILGYGIMRADAHPFHGEDISVFQLMANFLTLDLLRQGVITKTNVSGAGALKEFLEMGEIGAPEIEQWLAKQVCGNDECFRLFLINEARTSGGLLGDVDHLIGKLQQSFPQDVCTRIEAGAVLLVKTGPMIPAVQTASQIRTQIQRELLIGGSSTFTVLAESGRAALRQAESAIQMGLKIHPEKHFYLYEDYAVYVVLQAAAPKLNLEELISTELRQMLKEDRNGEQMRTLEVFLETGGKKAATAKKLFIHINSLKYRLAQIEARLHLDLDNPEVRFQLQYALHVIRYQTIFKQ